MPSCSKKTIIRENTNLGLDRAEKPDFSLNNFYYSSDKAKTDASLQTIKRRMCPVKKKEVNNVIDGRKKKTFLNQMVFYDRYNDFMVFESPSVRLVL